MLKCENKFCSMFFYLVMCDPMVRPNYCQNSCANSRIARLKNITFPSHLNCCFAKIKALNFHRKSLYVVVLVNYFLFLATLRDRASGVFGERHHDLLIIIKHVVGTTAQLVHAGERESKAVFSFIEFMSINRLFFGQDKHSRW